MFPQLVSNEMTREAGNCKNIIPSSPQTTLLSKNDEVSDNGTGRSSHLTGQDSASPTQTIAQGHEDASSQMDTPHTVTCKVTVVFAVPCEKDNESSPDCKAKIASKKRTVTTPKAQQYFHFEYFLLPEDTEATKVDVVLFDGVAKLYMAHESRLIKPWQENGKTWLLWSHSVDFRVTKDFLLKALPHQIYLKIWDTKDRVSTKARFDRPAAFKISRVKQEVKQMILDQQKLYEANLPKPSFILQKEGDIVFTKDIAPASKTTKPLKCVRFQECASAGSVEERPIMSNNGSSSMDMEERQTAGHKESHKQCIKQKEETFYLMTHLDKHASKVIKISKPKKKERKCVMINIDFMPLIAGDLSVSNRLEISTDTIMDCYMTVEINHPIQQKKDLNPLAIRILSAKDLPTRPTPISVLQKENPQN